MSNTGGRNLDGSEFTNITVVADDCNSTSGGSIEASGALFVNIIEEYNINTGVTLENSLFQGGTANINSTIPATNSTTASLIVNGGTFIQKDSIIAGILALSNTTNSFNGTSGSLVVNGGVGINENLSLNGQLLLFNTTPSDTSTAALISLGGITIQNTSNTVNCSTGGALTVMGGASIQKSLNVCDTIYGNIFSVFSTFSNLNVINITASNLITNTHFSSTSNFLNTNITNANLLIANVSTANIINTNISNGNIINLNSTISNIITLNSTSGNFESISVGNLYVSNSMEYNEIISNLSSANLISTYSTIVNLLTSFVTISNLTSTFGSINNLTSNFGSIGNLTSNFATVSNLISSLSSISNLSSSNSSIGNLINNNSTITNLVNNNSTITNLVVNYGSIGNLLGTYSSISNLISTFSTIGNLINVSSTITNALIQNASISNLSTSFFNLDGTSSSLNSSTGTLVLLYGGVSINNSVNSSSVTSGGALTIAGGASIFGDTYLNNSLFVYGSTSSLNSSTGTVILLDGGLSINTTSLSTSVTAGGALTIAGGASILQDVYIGGTIYGSNTVFTNGITTNSLYTNLISSSSLYTSNISSSNIYTSLVSNSNLYTNFITAGSANLSNLSSVNITTTNLSSNFGTFGNVNIINNLTSTGITSSSIWTTTITSDYINNNISLNSLYSTINNLITTNGSISNLNTSNVTFGSLFGSFTQSFTGTINTLVSNYSTIANLWVSSLLTSTQSLTGSIASLSSTTGTLVLLNGGLSINETTNSTSATRGGALTIAGGLGVAGSTFLNGILDLNNNKITNVTAPSSLLDVANKWYVDSLTFGNINANITQGQVVIASTGGNITSFPAFTFDGTLVSINSTVDSTSITDGGSLFVAGGASINKSLYIGNNAYIIGVLDMNNQKITNVTAPSSLLDVANKWYVDNRTTGNVNGNFTQGQVIIGGATSGSILGYNSFTFDGTLVSINSTVNSLGLGSGGSLNILGGASILGNVYLGSGLDLNGGIITNVTAPSSQLDVVNKWYVDQLTFSSGSFNGNFTQGQVLIGDTLGSVIGYPNFLFTNGTLLLSNTVNSTSFTNGGTLQINGGVGIMQNVYIGGGLDVNNTIITNMALPINPFDGVNKEYVDYYLGISNGDIQETSAALGNNVTTETSIPYFVFENTKVSSFEAFVYLQIPELNIYDQFELKGLLKGSTWILNSTFIGDNPNKVKFSIINSGGFGQIQYTNKNLTGTASIIYRAITTGQGSFSNITLGSLVRNVPGGGTGQTFFTNGCLLFGNGILPIETDSSIYFTSGTLHLNALNMNANIITNVTAPSSQLDVANKWYVDSKFSSGGSFNSLIIYGTENSFSSTSGSFINMGGAAINKNLYIGENLYVDGVNLTPNQYDIFTEQLFTASNNQISPANVTGFAFNNSSVKYFSAIVSVDIIASTNLSAGFELKGIQTGTGWKLNSTFLGDQTQIRFSINSLGQIQYKSSNIPGFISNTIKFRASTLSI